MANIYKNAKVDLTNNSETAVLTVPSDSRAIIKSILVSEDSGNADSITAITDASSNVFSPIQDKAVSTNATVELLSQPLVLQEVKF